MRTIAVLLPFVLLLVGTSATADCCRIVKVDTETPPSQVRVCEPDATGTCGSVLLVGTLALGESETVCPSTETVVYAEYDDAVADFGPSTEAVCEGDVEL